MAEQKVQVGVKWSSPIHQISQNFELSSSSQKFQSQLFRSSYNRLFQDQCGRPTNLRYVETVRKFDWGKWAVKWARHSGSNSSGRSRLEQFLRRWIICTFYIEIYWARWVFSVIDRSAALFGNELNYRRWLWSDIVWFDSTLLATPQTVITVYLVKVVVVLLHGSELKKCDGYDL